MSKSKKQVVTGIVAAYSILTSVLFPVNATASLSTSKSLTQHAAQTWTTPEDVVRRTIGLADTTASSTNESVVFSNQSLQQIMASSSNRISGTDRYETAAKIAQEGWKNTSDYAVISAGMDENLVDALTVVPLAKSKNAPILLTEGDALNSYTRSELIRLQVKTVYVTSGLGVITQSVLEELKGMGIAVKELGGIDRFQTAINIAKELGSRDKLIIATGFTNADALSIGSIAAIKGIPILLSAPDMLPDNVVKYLDEIRGDVTQTYIIGGEGALSQTVKNALPNPVRIGGKDRYETNIEILKAFASDLNYSQSYVASGEDTHLVDAITGAPLAARTQSPILLADHYLSEATKAYASSMLSPQTIAFGGETVIPEDTLEQLVAAKVYSDDNITLGSTDEATPLNLEERISVVGKNVTISNTNTPFSLYVQADELNLKNLNVEGTLFIDTGETGVANLENVKADHIVVLSSEKTASIQSSGKARIAAAESTTAGIHLKNVQSNSLIVDSQSNIDTSGLTQIINTIIRSAAVVNVVEGSLGQVQVGGASTDTPPTVELKGKIDSVIITAQVTVVSSSANIKKLLVQPNEQDAQISLQGNFGTLEIARPGQIQLGADTKIMNTIVNSSAVLDATQGSFGKVEVAKASAANSEAVVLFKGTFNDTITVSGQAIIKKDENTTLTKIEVQVVLTDQKVTFEGAFKPTEVIEVIKGDNAAADANLSINVPKGSSVDTVVDKSGISTSEGGGTVNGEETSSTPISTPPAETTPPAPGPGGGGNPTPAVTVNTVTITNSDLFVPEGGKPLQLTAEVRLSNGTLDISGVTWELTNPAMSEFATIDANGLVTPLKYGTVTIKATSKKDTSKSTTVNLTVEEVPVVKDGIATFSNGTSIKGLPASLSVSASEVTIISNPSSGIEPVGKIMDFSASGDFPVEGVVLEIPVNPGTTDAGLSTLNEATGKYELVPGSELDQVNNVVRATVHHFSRYGALKVTPQIVANGISSVTAPAQATTTLALPEVPSGFEISIKSSSNEAVIAKNGTITLPDAATQVNLVFTVKKTADGTTADTQNITVTVPAKSVIPDTEAPNVVSASATIGGQVVNAIEKEDGWYVDLSKQPDTAQFTHMTITADQDTTEAFMTIPLDEGATVSKTISFTNGIADVDIHSLLGSLDSGEEGLAIGNLRKFGMTSFIAQLKDASGNVSDIVINLETQYDITPPQVQSAKALIGGNEVIAQKQENEWTVDLSEQPDSAMFTNMTIIADPDTTEGFVSYEYNGLTLEKTISFTDGVANVDIKTLLEDLDTGAEGVSVGKLRELGINTFTATLKDASGNSTTVNIRVNVTSEDTISPEVKAASATIGGQTVQAEEQADGSWLVDLSIQPDEAMFTDLTIEADPDAASAHMSVEVAEGTTASRDITFVNGMADVNIHELLGVLDQGEDGVSMAKVRSLGLTDFTAEIKDASGNSSTVIIRLKATAADTIAPQVQSAKALIGGNEVIAQKQGSEWFVDLSQQEDSAMFTDMTITADPDTTEGFVSYEYNGSTLEKTVSFTDGVATVNIKTLLEELDTGADGVSVGKLRELGISTFTATLKDASGNSTTVNIRVNVTSKDTISPEVKAARATIGGQTVQAEEQVDGSWLVDLSTQPDEAMFTDLTIEADPDAASAHMSVEIAEGTTVSRDIIFENGIALVNIHTLLGILDTGEEGISMAKVRSLGLMDFTAEIKDASGNSSTVTIWLKATAADTTAPQVQSAKSTIGGVEVVAQEQENEWTVDLSEQPDSAMFTDMTITADPDTTEGFISYEYNDSMLEKTVSFTNGVANVNVKTLLEGLDTGSEGVSVGKLRELGISTFTATLKDASGNSATVNILVVI